MTDNDNEKYYIGEVLSNKDINEQIRYIYDLMTANGGDGSGIDADMLDGYHASEFAKVDVENLVKTRIKEGTLIGETAIYNDVENYITTDDVNLTNKNDPAYFGENSLTKKLYQIEKALSQINTSTFVRAKAGYSLINNLDYEDLKFLSSHIQLYDTDEASTYRYLNSDSVNGLSFILITQADYDNLSDELKKNWHNVYIIRDNLDSNYNAPTLLGAGQTLQFRIKNNTLEYSIVTNQWHSLVTLYDLVTLESLKNLNSQVDGLGDSEQADFPFILRAGATFDNLQALRQSLKDITYNGVSLGPENNIVDLKDVLDNNFYHKEYIDTELALKENLSNKIQSLTESSSTQQYPSAKAVVQSLSTKANVDHTHDKIVSRLDDLEKIDISTQTVYNFNSVGKNIIKNRSAPNLVDFPRDKSQLLFSRIGNVVQFSCNFYDVTLNPTSVGEQYSICDIPIGYRPSVEAYMIFKNQKANIFDDGIKFGVSGALTNTTNKGSIDIYPNFGELQKILNCGFSATWLTTDTYPATSDSIIIGDNTSSGGSGSGSGSGAGSLTKLATTLSITSNPTIYRHHELRAKLLDANNQPVANKGISFKLTDPRLGASKIYQANTNSAGIAILDINLVPNTYTMKVSFDATNDSNYAPSEASEVSLEVLAPKTKIQRITSFNQNPTEDRKDIAPNGYRYWRKSTIEFSESSTDWAIAGDNSHLISGVSKTAAYGRPSDIIVAGNINGGNAYNAATNNILHDGDNIISIEASWDCYQEPYNTTSSMGIKGGNLTLQQQGFDSLTYSDWSISGQGQTHVSKLWTREQASGVLSKPIADFNSLVKNTVRLTLTHTNNKTSVAGKFKIKNLQLIIKYVPKQE